MPTYYWDADKDALLRRTPGISSSIPDQSKPPPGAIDQDDPWPFADDLDDYERELEALYQPRDWRSDPGRQERLARHQEMARIALENGSYGPVPEGMPCPPAWLEYIRNGKTPPPAAAEGSSPPPVPED